MTSWTLYWITRLDAVGWLLIGAVVLSIGAACVNGFLWGEEFDPKSGDSRRYFKRVRKFSALALLLSLTNTMIPSTKEMAAIIVLPKIANSATVKELGDATVELAKQWLESLKPKKEESK